MIVAGADDQSYHQFQGTEWHVPAHVYDFVENMPTLMHAADCIVCKAVGLIVTELKHHAIIGKEDHCHAAQKSR